MNTKEVFSILQKQLTLNELEMVMKEIKYGSDDLISTYEARIQKEQEDVAHPTNQGINKEAYNIYYHIKETLDRIRTYGSKVESPEDAMDAHGIAASLKDVDAEVLFGILVKLKELDTADCWAQLMFQVFVHLEIDFYFPHLQDVYNLIRNAPKDTFTDCQLERLMEEF